MDDPAARYSIALRSRLPKIAKARTQITALFVASTGAVEEVQ